MRIRKIIFCILGIIFFLNVNVFAEEQIVAIVNNEIVTQKDLDGFLNYMRVKLSQQYSGEKLEEKIKEMKTDLLQRLIEDKLILQQARKENIKVDSNRIKGRINEIKKSYATDKDFQEALIDQGLSEADLSKRIEEQILNYAIIEQKVKDKIQVNPTEITEYYNANINDFGSTEQREFNSLTFTNEDDAYKVYKRLRYDEKTIEGLLKEFDFKVNKVTAKKGGELRKEFEDIVFSLQAKEMSKPIQLDDNYYIFQLLEIIPEQHLSLTEAQDTVYNLVMEKKMQEGVVKWLDELKKKAYIKITE